jgi:hypothetical protein
MAKLILLICAICSLHCGIAPECSNTILSEVASDDARYVAALVERNCGATTDYSTIITLRLATSAFSADSGIVFVAKGRQEVGIRWISETNVRVTCSSCAERDVFKREPVWKDVSILYDLKPESLALRN